MTELDHLPTPSERVEDWVRRAIPTWFPGATVGELRSCAILGGREGRVNLIFVDRRGRRARIVVKVGTRVANAGHVLRERDALGLAHTCLPLDITAGIPVPLELYDDGQVTALAMTALPGTVVRLPDLTRNRPRRQDAVRLAAHVRAVRGWSRRLAGAGAACGPTLLNETRIGLAIEALLSSGSVPPAPRSCLAGLHASLGASFGWEPVWQHGDVASGNALYHRGGIRFVDWEAARATHMPWLDDTYLILSLARSAQRSLGTPTVSSAMRQVLRRSSWCGDVLRSIYDDDWPHPIPLGMALLLTAIEQTRLPDESVDPASTWIRLVIDLLSDDELRRDCDWLVP
jgi:hypothetical protein